jgi:pyridoxal phosphate enzyme (YggS family)
MSEAGAPRSADRRSAEIVSGLAAVRTRIADACARAGRDPQAVTIVAVTKTYPADDVLTLADLGVQDIGENRDHEAAAKSAEVAQRRPELRLRWHFVGQVQTRKARSIARYAHSVHAVDRPELVAELAAAVDRVDRAALEVFVQVSLDGDPHRGGAPPDAVAALTDAVAAQSALVLRGVMAVAPLGADPESAFGRLAEIAAEVRRAHPGADAISAGMSSDLAEALRHGSTHVRVGSALLGPRGPVFG